jgi:lysyl-tRNA synthetase class 1
MNSTRSVDREKNVKPSTPIVAASENSEGTLLDFNELNTRAILFADRIEEKFDVLVDILLEYESFEVATDEIYRTLDVLRHLSENIDYFKIRTGAVTSFLPRNQPLYALTCFVIVPSLMATGVHFRTPHCLKELLPKLITFLDITTTFPNLTISTKDRVEFLKERSALLVNPITHESKPVTSTVIFTGTPVHADQLRLVFDKRTLFITNGAGHNPIVVTPTADIKNAVTATLTLNLYNQGQDCAAPNSILVHQYVYSEFMEHLLTELTKVQIGPYTNRTCRVGPISNPDDLKYIQETLVDNRQWLDAKTPGNICTAEVILEPTIICRPLREGGNYHESFAPILFIQEYEDDTELASYFNNEKYYKNAMYITVYGKSKYVSSLIGKSINGKVLHTADTVLFNTHLHEHGVERGTEPYGGYGYGASSISINGQLIAKPTLPQRDIFEQVAQPLIAHITTPVAHFTEIEYKNVEKILKLRTIRKMDRPEEKPIGLHFLDLHSIKTEARYINIADGVTYLLLTDKNAECISELHLPDRTNITALVELIDNKKNHDLKSFCTAIYAIPKSEHGSDREKASLQLHFFKTIYKLLFNSVTGPKIGNFLWEVENDLVTKLLDV